MQRAYSRYVLISQPAFEFINISSGATASSIAPESIRIFAYNRASPGKVGFIAPISWHFCAFCNRLRLTADGKIKACLFSQKEIDLKGPLRNGAEAEEIIDIFRRAVHEKPSRHHLNEKNHRHACQRAMRAIGG